MSLWSLFLFSSLQGLSMQRNPPLLPCPPLPLETTDNISERTPHFLSTRPFLNSLLKLRRRNGDAKYHTSNNSNCSQPNGPCQKSEGQNTSSFSFFQEPCTDLPFCHSQPCHVHPSHLTLVKYRHVVRFVVWCSRVCGDMVCFFCFVHIQYVLHVAQQVGGQDWGALDNVEFSKKHVTHGWNLMNMVSSMAYLCVYIQ